MIQLSKNVKHNLGKLADKMCIRKRRSGFNWAAGCRRPGAIDWAALVNGDLEGMVKLGLMWLEYVDEYGLPTKPPQELDVENSFDPTPSLTSGTASPTSTSHTASVNDDLEKPEHLLSAARLKRNVYLTLLKVPILYLLVHDETEGLSDWQVILQRED